MRYGVLADIHGNLHALEAALTVLRESDVDRFLCAGDLVGYGPFPNECVETVANLGAVCVAGNHDLIAAGRLTDERCASLARETLCWTRRALTQTAATYIASLPVRVATRDGIVLSHGSLTDPEASTARPDQALEQARVLAADFPRAEILILGHTHVPLAFSEERRVLALPRGGVVSLVGDGRYVLNPGSVGQSRERRVRARFMLLDLEERRAVFHAVPYDVARCRQALREKGLPPNSYHLPPSRGRALRRRFRRAAGRFRSSFGIWP